MKKIIIALVAAAAGYAIGNLSLAHAFTNCAHKYGSVCVNEVDKKHVRVSCGDGDSKIFKL